ncbi:hypothetical protein D3C81_1760860 [compost metagenome]
MQRAVGHQHCTQFMQDGRDHLVGNGQDQPAVLRKGNEQVRGHHLATGFTPSDQRFGTDAAPALNLDEWLVVNLELMPAYRPFKRGKGGQLASPRAQHCTE